MNGPTPAAVSGHDGLAARVNHKLKMPNKVYPQNREINGGEEEGPGHLLAAKLEAASNLTPALDRAAAWI
jgi:hypothetical protein